MKMIYTISAYSYLIYSINKLMRVDIISEHISTNDPFNIDIEKALMNNCVNKINLDLISNKERVVTKLNVN